MTKSVYHTTGRRASGHFSSNNIRLVHSGPEFFDLLESLIGQAVAEIQFQFYVFNDDTTGWRIARALVEAANRGVAVYILIDGYKAGSLSGDFLRFLDVPNIHLERFEPLFRSRKFYVGRRMHHKIAVFDGNRTLIGGINIADRYMGTDTTPAWLDFALYLEGAATAQVRAVSTRYWKDETGDTIDTKLPEGLLPAHRKAGDTLEHCSVRIRRNDWVKGYNEIWKSYFEIFNHATESIVVMCSYFLPGWTFLRRIKKAIARGVRVQVILAGQSDVMLAKHAERYLYRWMLRNGVEVYEYKGSVLHAKIAIRDHKWMTIGSYNVNNISALASIELNLDVRNKPFVSKVEQELVSIIKDRCERITHGNFTARQNIFKQFWQWLCYQVIKIILFTATFYFQRES